MHEVQYLYVAFPCTFSIDKNWVKSCYNTIIITKNNSIVYEFRRITLVLLYYISPILITRRAFF